VPVSAILGKSSRERERVKERERRRRRKGKARESNVFDRDLKLCIFSSTD